MQKVYLPSPVYRLLPALYLATALILFAFVDHLAVTVVGVALVALAASVTLKRIAAS